MLVCFSSSVLITGLFSKYTSTNYETSLLDGPRRMVSREGIERTFDDLDFSPSSLLYANYQLMKFRPLGTTLVMVLDIQFKPLNWGHVCQFSMYLSCL